MRVINNKMGGGGWGGHDGGYESAIAPDREEEGGCSLVSGFPLLKDKYISQI